MNNAAIKHAGKVSRFMMDLSHKFSERWNKIDDQFRIIPYGDLAYGQALEHWHKDNRNPYSHFSYAVGEKPCPFLMEFRKEISTEFGLEILTPEEGELRSKELSKCMPVYKHKVTDWGPN